MALDILRRREIPVVLTSLIIVICVASEYLTVSAIDSTATQLKTWTVLITALSLGFAVIKLFEFELGNIRDRAAEWPFSIWTIVFTIIVWILGILPGYPFLAGPQFGFVLLNVIGTGDSTFWSISGAGVIAGAYRAFRIKNWISGIMVALIVIICIWYIPGVMFMSPTYNSFANWIWTYTTLGGDRASAVAGALGSTAVCIRTMFGKERGYLR